VGYNSKRASRLKQQADFGQPPAGHKRREPGYTRSQNEPDRGPAAATISSATTAARLPRPISAVSAVQIFRPNQPVYLLLYP
jgi:hypothetical protein